MPCGRKAANSQKGGGFGKALGAHSNKYGKRTDYRTPDASKLLQGNEPTLPNSFAEKNDQSVIEPSNLEDFIQHKLKEQADLVDYNRRSKKSTSIQIISHTKPITRRDLPEESAYTHHTIPLRPIRFTDCTSRLLDFAITLGYYLCESPGINYDEVSSDSASENHENDVLSDKTSDCDSSQEVNSNDESSEDNGISECEYKNESESILDGTSQSPNPHSLKEPQNSTPVIPSLATVKLDDSEALRRATKLSDGHTLLNALVVHFTKVENCAPFLDKETVAQAEEQTFSHWRSQLEDERDRTCSISPFEKNINFWRELWHTIERSDLILEITDARNPLLFHSPRLTDFVRKCRKEYVLVLNKADYLTKIQREQWKSYFKQKDITVIMYSALKEIQANQRASREEPCTDSRQNEICDNKSMDTNGHEHELLNIPETMDANTSVRHVSDWESVSNREELLQMLEEASEKHAKKRVTRLKTMELFLGAWKHLMNGVEVSLIRKTYKLITRNLSEKLEVNLPDRSKEFEKDILGFLFGTSQLDTNAKHDRSDFTAGTIGFPNVGKSSLINSIVGSFKRVGVSGTPGKTKHIQTLLIPGVPVQLCDCPGLVMPISNRSKEDLVINGIISVDTYRGELTSAIGHILKRIPEKLQVVFSISGPKMKEIWNLVDTDLHQAGINFVDVVAGQRNYYAAGRGGQKDVIRSCRLIIKAYIGGGALVYCEKCPTASEQLWTQESDVMWKSQIKSFSKIKEPV